MGAGTAAPWRHLDPDRRSPRHHPPVRMGAVLRRGVTGSRGPPGTVRRSPPPAPNDAPARASTRPGPRNRTVRLNVIRMQKTLVKPPRRPSGGQGARSAWRVRTCLGGSSGHTADDPSGHRDAVRRDHAHRAEPVGGGAPGRTEVPRLLRGGRSRRLPDVGPAGGRRGRRAGAVAGPDAAGGGADGRHRAGHRADPGRLQVAVRRAAAGRHPGPDADRGLRRGGDAADERAPSPGPDFRLAIGDILVVVGTREGVDALAAIVAGS